MSLRGRAPEALNLSSFWPALVLLLLAVGLQFQIILPVGSAGLKICPADTIAALLAAQMIFYCFHDHSSSLCLSRTLPYWLIVCSTVLAVSTAIGFARMGYIPPWALGNRLAGWGVLVAYLACGLFVGTVLGSHGLRRFARLFIYACVSTGLLSAFLSVALAHTAILPPSLTHFPVHGFVGNRNAFVFLQASAMTLLLAHGWSRMPFLGTREREVLCGICGTVMLYSGSRSGLPAAGIILLLAMMMGAISLRCLIRSVFYGLACGLALELARDALIWGMRVYELIEAGDWSSGAWLASFTVNPPRLTFSNVTGEGSDLERLRSYKDAFELWLTAPIFGAGLGSALETSIAKRGSPVVIHNTALWLLTETGIVGLAAFLGLAWSVTRSLFPLRASNDTACFRLAALLMLVVFAIMSLVHEMLYQRVLWLILGLALAIPRIKTDRCAD